MFAFHTLLTHLNAFPARDGTPQHTSTLKEIVQLYSKDYMFDETRPSRVVGGGQPDPAYRDQIKSQRLYAENIAWTSTGLNLSKIKRYCKDIDAHLWLINFGDSDVDQIELQSRLFMRSFFNMTKRPVLKISPDTQMLLMTGMKTKFHFSVDAVNRLKFSIKLSEVSLLGELEVEMTPLDRVFDYITIQRQGQAKYKSFSAIFEKLPIMTILKQIHDRFVASPGLRETIVPNQSFTSAIPMSWVSDALPQVGTRKRLLPVKQLQTVFNTDSIHAGVSEIDHYSHIEITDKWIYSASTTFASINELSSSKSTMNIHADQQLKTMVVVIHDHYWNVVVCVAHVDAPI